MKIKSANKVLVSNNVNLPYDNVLDHPEEYIPNSPIEMFDAEIYEDPELGTINFVLSFLPELLLVNKISKIHVLANFPNNSVTNTNFQTTLSEEALDNFFANYSSSNSSPSVPISEIDVTQFIDKSRISLLINSPIDELDLNTELTTELEFEASGNLIDLLDQESFALDIKNFENISPKAEDSLTDLRKKAYSNFTKNTTRNNQVSNLLASQDPLLKEIYSNAQNKVNFKESSLVTKSGLLHGLNSNTDELQDIQIPFIKNLKTTSGLKKASVHKSYDYSNIPTVNFSIIAIAHNGEIFEKNIKKTNKLEVDFNSTARHFKGGIPKISTTAINKNEVLVSVSGFSMLDDIQIYRREISQKPLEDKYTLIGSLNKTGLTNFEMFDYVSPNMAYKYVCILKSNNNYLPVYSYSIYVPLGYDYSKYGKPFIYAYQNEEQVMVQIKDLPSSYRKVLLYRINENDYQSDRSSPMVLSNGGTITSAVKSTFEIRDTPNSLADQRFRYILKVVDESGVNSKLDTDLSVFFNRASDRRSGILEFTANYNKSSDSVMMNGVVSVPNAFIATSQSELSNPSNTTLEAASRRQNIAKIQIKRIDKTNEKSEIIFNEIINSGITQLQAEMVGLNQIQFRVEDNSTNSSFYQYPPIKDLAEYDYIARLIIYPLGLELKKVADYKTIKGISESGRIPYEYDSAVLDHPLHIEAGIIPAADGSSTNDIKLFRLADVYGRTSKAIRQSVSVVKKVNSQTMDFSAGLSLDKKLNPIVRLSANIPNYLKENLDHIEVMVEYDTVANSDIIDKIFINDNSNSFTYYDYQIHDLAANTVTYKLIGKGRDFSTIFTSDKKQVSLRDGIFQRALKRKKYLSGH